jgi:hypothetical protein
MGLKDVIQNRLADGWGLVNTAVSEGAKDALRARLAHIAAVAAPTGAIVAWLDVIDRMVRIGAGLASIGAAVYAIKYYRSKIRANQEQHDRNAP